MRDFLNLILPSNLESQKITCFLKLVLYIGLISIIGLSSVGCDQPIQQSIPKPKTKKTAQKEPSSKPYTIKTEGPSSVSNRKINVGVLDFNKVWHSAKAPLQIRDVIQEKRREYQRNVITLEEKLRQQEDDLQAQREGESAEDYKKRRKEFEAEVLSVQKQVQVHKQQLEKAYSSAMGQVSEKLNQIVKQIATNKGLDLILSQTHVAFNNDELNITEQVMQELDTSLPSVEITG